LSYLVSKPDSNERLDLDYFLEWRPRLWRRPFLFATRGETGLKQLAGMRVLDFGCRYGKMSCLFGIFGASVIGVDIDAQAVERAREEVRNHHLEQRVKILHTHGDVRNLQQSPFDIVFTKSVLYYRKNLDEILGQLHAVLRPTGRVIFIENYLGSRLEAKVRRHLFHRRWMNSVDDYVGIRKAQLPIFNKWFENLQFQSFWRICCVITGTRRNFPNFF
jgi:2-polyprenyl-3-methyl-5-hydroxy-6-metoxy-1,4-benzoquinol methylase